MSLFIVSLPSCEQVTLGKVKELASVFVVSTFCSLSRVFHIFFNDKFIATMHEKILRGQGFKVMHAFLNYTGGTGSSHLHFLCVIYVSLRRVLFLLSLCFFHMEAEVALPKPQNSNQFRLSI